MIDPRRSRSGRHLAALAALLIGLATPQLAGSVRAQATLAPASRAAAAAAQASAAEQQRAAGSLFEEARRDRDAGLLGKAVDGYRAALARWDHPIIRYDLAFVLLELRDPVAASEQLDQVIRGGRAELADDRVYEHAVATQQKLLAHELAHLEVTCWMDGARIIVDNDEARAWVIRTRAADAQPTRITHRVLVRAGLHTILAELPGGPLVPVQRRVRPGATLHVTIAPPARRRGATPAWMPWALASTGLLLWAAGSALHHSADAISRRAGAMADVCTHYGTGCAPSRVAGLRDSEERQRTLGFLGYGLAGAAVVAGGVLAYVNRRAAAPAPDVRPAPARSTAVAPLVGPGFGGAAVTGWF